MKKFKKALCMLLAGLMVLSFAACNNNNGDQKTDGDKTNSVKTDSEAKKYVYSYQDIEMGVSLDNMHLYDMQFVDGRVYALVEDYNNEVDIFLNGGTPPETDSAIAEGETGVGEPVPYMENDGIMLDTPVMDDYEGPAYYVLAVNMDGSDFRATRLETQAGGYRELYDENGNVIGSESGYISNATLLRDGSVVVVYEMYHEDYSDPENSIWENTMSMMRWDAEGTLLWEKDVTPEDGGYFYAQNITSDEAGNIIIIGGDNLLFTYDNAGNEIGKVELQVPDSMYSGQVLVKNDGSMYMTSYNNEWTKVYLSKIDTATGQLGEAQETAGNLTNYSIYAGTTTDLLLSNSMGIYTYNLGDAEPTKVMDFINSDLATYNLNNVNIIDDKTFIASYDDVMDYSTHTAVFTYVDPADIPDKETITLGCFYLGRDIKSRVINYNKTNSQYRITINSYMDAGDYETAMTKMNNDIISGKMPDILVVDSSQDITSWINKGLLADIEKMIAADEELSQKEFLTNVWEAFSVNGGLYTLVPDFNVQTYVAKKSLVGDRTGWTMSEFKQFMSTLEEDVKPFGNSELLRDSFIYYVMQYCGSDFVDVNTGKCNFDTDEFVAMLEYANGLATEYSDDYWDDYDWELEESQYRDNRAVLMNAYIYRIQDLVYQLHGNLGDEAVFIGFPGVEGNSSIIQPGSYMYAISERSKVKDGAWEFLRYYLTDEYQESDELYSLPVSKKALEKQAKESTERPYWIDTEGNKVEYDNTYYISGEEIILDPFSQEEADAICDFISSVTRRYYYNDNIINIVNEEAAYYFSGDKSAKEVAGLIQNRVQLYVDENS